MAETQILVASNGDTAQIKVEGRATYRCCPELEIFAKSFIKHEKYSFVINLEACEAMDSTFMGLLAIIGIPCKKNGTAATIVNVSPSNQKLLDELGVSKLFEFKEMEHSEEWLSLDCKNSSDVDQKKGELMLEAHETLNKVSSDNVPKFKDVIEYLRDDLKKYDE